MGMFEQSLLLDPAAARKTGALAASLTVQTLAVGLMIAIPLIYSDRLPSIPPFIPLSLPSPTSPTPLPQKPAVINAASRADSGPARIFSAPRHIVNLSEIPAVDTVEAPQTYTTNPDTGVPGGMGGSSLMSQLFSDPLPKARPPVTDPPKPPAKPTVVGGDVQAAKLLKKVIPAYPPLARQARVSGTVRLLGVIAKDGTIQQLQVTSGHPLLAAAALSAVRQWIYRPTLLNGQAVEVIAPIDVNFTLSQ